MMTVQEHDDNWMASAKSLQCIPGVANSLRRANAIAILKELYTEGAITKLDYIHSLVELIEKEGFKIDNLKF